MQTDPSQQPPSGTQSPERLTFTVREAAAAIGLSVGGAYEAIRRGEIPSLKIGSRVLVPRVALEQMLANACKVAP